jgi:hypothetical protein
MKHGTYVTRSTYQKVVEENKKLLNDIRILVQERSYQIPPPVEKLLVIEKWRTKFAQDRELVDMLQQMFKKTIVDPAKVIRKSPIFIAENKSKEDEN